MPQLTLRQAMREKRGGWHELVPSGIMIVGGILAMVDMGLGLAILMWGNGMLVGQVLMMMAGHGRADDTNPGGRGEITHE